MNEEQQKFNTYNKISQKIDASFKIQEIVNKYNLNISDKEITDWINLEPNLMSFNEILKDYSEDTLKTINKELNSGFTTSNSISDILKEISKQWKSIKSNT